MSDEQYDETMKMLSRIALALEHLLAVHDKWAKQGVNITVKKPKP